MRYWVKAGKKGKTAHARPKGTMVYRYPGRPGFTSEKLAHKRRRDAAVKRAKREAAKKAATSKAA